MALTVGSQGNNGERERETGRSRDIHMDKDRFTKNKERKIPEQV